MGSRVVTPVRWREDTGWEFRCGDCAKAQDACFWPLADEFWDKARGMVRCRACWRALDRRASRESYARLSPEAKAEKVAARRRYRSANRKVQHLKDAAKWQRIKADPILLERARQKSRESTARYRARQREARAA